MRDFRSTGIPLMGSRWSIIRIQVVAYSKKRKTQINVFIFLMHWSFAGGADTTVIAAGAGKVNKKKRVRVRDQ